MQGGGRNPEAGGREELLLQAAPVLAQRPSVKGEQAVADRWSESLRFRKNAWFQKVDKFRKSHLCRDSEFQRFTESQHFTDFRHI